MSHRAHQGVLLVTRIPTVTANGAVAFMVLLLSVVLTTPALGTSEKNGPKNLPGQAQFEGRQINLQRGWGDARTCVVWNEDGETDCFRAEAAADAAIARQERTEQRAKERAGARAARVGGAAMTGAWGLDPGNSPPTTIQAQLTSACSTWLYLYEHDGHAGRSLRFRDTATTQDLADWGFASQTSSYRVGACPVTLRDAGGSAYPGWTEANTTASSMAAGWNDRVRYLRIH